jgi:hypothetical protein
MLKSIVPLFIFLFTCPLVHCAEVPNFELIRAKVIQKYEIIQNILPNSIKIRIDAIFHDINSPAVDYSIDEEKEELKIIYKNIKKCEDLLAISKFYWKLTGYLSRSMNVRARGLLNDEVGFDELKEDPSFRYLIQNFEWAKKSLITINLIYLKRQLKSKKSNSPFVKIKFNILFSLSEESIENKLNVISNSINKKNLNESEKEFYKFYLSNLKKQTVSLIDWLLYAEPKAEPKAEKQLNKAIGYFGMLVDGVIHHYNL